MEDAVNRFVDASVENPPDNVAPLNEQRFIMKYIILCLIASFSIVIIVRRKSMNISLVICPMYLYSSSHNSVDESLQTFQNWANGPNPSFIHNGIPVLFCKKNSNEPPPKNGEIILLLGFCTDTSKISGNCSLAILYKWSHARVFPPG